MRLFFSFYSKECGQKKQKDKNGFVEKVEKMALGALLVDFFACLR